MYCHTHRPSNLLTSRIVKVNGSFHHEDLICLFNGNNDVILGMEMKAGDVALTGFPVSGLS